MIRKFKERKKTVTGLVILSLFVDGFCLGYLFSFYNWNSHKQIVSHKVEPPPRLVASASPVEGIDTSTGNPENSVRTTPEIEPLYFKELPARESENETGIITPLIVPESPASTSAPPSAPASTPAAAPVSAPDAVPTRREEEIPYQGRPVAIPPAQRNDEKELEALERANKLHSPQDAAALRLNVTEENISPFLAWPKFQFEVGPESGRDSYQSTIGPFTLNNSSLVNGTGYFIRAQTTLGTRLVTEAKYVSAFGTIANPGNTVIDQSFQTDEATLSIRYRVLSNHHEGLGYYIGLGAVHTDDYRYSYLNNLGGLIVNRPESFDDLKISVGTEMNSYYLFRGRFELNYYQNLANSSASANWGQVLSLQTALCTPLIAPFLILLLAIFIWVWEFNISFTLTILHQTNWDRLTKGPLQKQK